MGVMSECVCAVTATCRCEATHSSHTHNAPPTNSHLHTAALPPHRKQEIKRASKAERKKKNTNVALTRDTQRTEPEVSSKQLVSVHPVGNSLLRVLL